MNHSCEKYRLGLHLMPPSGWMNDPNGCCFYQGKYHVFFQYAPESPTGKTRYWGHYVSKDLISWEYIGIAIKSDTEWDRNGAYSGSAFTDDGKMEIFYTGNVKEPGDFDYVLKGRGANVIGLISEDGISFPSPKELLMTNSDYPDDYTCHVRDPKVWKKDDTYYMVLGGRKKGDKGAILEYCSKDKVHWELCGELTTEEIFGYMWECPDAFDLEGHTIVMCCPQGVNREEYRYQNIYQSGYFVLDDRTPENLKGLCEEEQFHELDYGFDFYAPQTFLAEDGRRIMFGWAGMPDMEAEYNNEPIIQEGWQHSQTLPRELSFRNGQMYQYPVKEIEQLRQESKYIDGSLELNSKYFDLIVSFDDTEKQKEICFDGDIKISFSEGICKLELLGDCGSGRKVRNVKLSKLEEVRIVRDVSMLEIFLNHGEVVMTTRYFPNDVENTKITIVGSKKAIAYPMKAMNVTYLVEDEKEM